MDRQPPGRTGHHHRSSATPVSIGVSEATNRRRDDQPSGRPSCASGCSARSEVITRLGRQHHLELVTDRAVPYSTTVVGLAVVGPAGVFLLAPKTCERVTGDCRYFNRHVSHGSEPERCTRCVDSLFDLQRQTDVVRSVLEMRFPHVAVRSILYFPDCRVGCYLPAAFPRYATLWGFELDEHVTAPGPHADSVHTIAAYLRAELPRTERW